MMSGIHRKKSIRSGRHSSLFLGVQRHPSSRSRSPCANRTSRRETLRQQGASSPATLLLRAAYRSPIGAFRTSSPASSHNCPPLTRGRDRESPLGSTKRGTPARNVATECNDSQTTRGLSDFSNPLCGPTSFFSLAFPVSYDITASTPNVPSSNAPVARIVSFCATTDMSWLEPPTLIQSIGFEESPPLEPLTEL